MICRAFTSCARAILALSSSCVPTRLPFTTLERAVISELHGFFRPELIGRFDEKIVFRPLSSEVQREIGRAAIDLEIERFSEHGFDLTVSESRF